MGVQVFANEKASLLSFSMAPAVTNDCVLFSDGLIRSTKKADRNFVRDILHCLHLRMSLHFVGTSASSNKIQHVCSSDV